VLAFVDLSAEQDDDYFAQGLSEEILNLLATSTSLRVIARTSSFAFKGRDAGIETIANTLHVSHILEGSVRKSGGRVRITAQLIDASDSTEIWSSTFEEEIGDIPALQAKVAASVANSLEANLLGANPLASSSARRVNPQAFDLYLRGQEQLRFFTAESLAKAEGYFTRAIQIDPDFIPSYYRLGFVYVMQVVDVQVPIEENRAKLRDVVNRGLALSPDNAGLIGLSGQLARYDGENDLAERQLRRAMAIDPSNIPVRMLNAMFVGDQGYPEKALEIGRGWRDVDPLNPLQIIGTPFVYIDLWGAREAMVAASHIKAVPGASEYPLYAVIKLLLLGDFAGAVRDSRTFMRGIAAASEVAYGYPSMYFDLGDLNSGDAALRLWRRFDPDTAALDAVEVQQMIAHGDLDTARTRAIEILERDRPYTGHWNNDVVARVATDALIETGRAQHAVDLIEALAPVYASYKVRSDVDVHEFSPPPFPVKSNYSSFPAIYFPDYIHALRASGDDAGADNMLGHLDAILQDRRKRGLYLEERYTAEALALGGKNEDALDALEQAETDRTIYRNWEVFLPHSSLFSNLRDHPRFAALVERTKLEMARQLAELTDE
jgi:TolB-like protein